MNKIIHTISAVMEKPVIVLLILLIGVTAVLAGFLLAEYFTEHRHLHLAMPALLGKLKAAQEGEDPEKGKNPEKVEKPEKVEMEKVIREAGLFPRQRDKLLELIRHPEYTDFMRESLAVRLLQEEQEYYDRRVLITDLIAKVAPMLGLLGTLIPLGPGIIALGQGDTATLSTSLLTAFDTTVVGLICAAVAMVISAIRNLWYRDYMSIFETLMECILELEKNDA